MKRFVSYLTAKNAGYAAIAIAVVVGGWYFFGKSTNNAAQTLVLAPQDFVQAVAVSGKVVAAQDVDLGFSQGGRIARVYVGVGDRVGQGAVLAEVENGDLRANVAQQQALLEQQQAKLSSLKAGAQPEDIAASQAALDKAKQDLNNLYQGILDADNSAYLSADDAVHTQLSSLFSNSDSSNPQLTFSSGNSQIAINAQNARVQAGGALASWQSELSALAQAPSNAQLSGALTHALAYLATIKSLLGYTSSALDSSTLSSSALSADKALVVAAQTEVNAAVKNLNSISQSIASQVSTVSQAQAQLDLKRAGSTAQDIAAQQALVAQAEAGLQSAQAQLGKTIITAPFAGVITAVNAKVGLAAAASAAQISIESAGTFQIESYVPEVSIAQVSVGNEAKVTLDAYGADVPFSASVVSIDPAETVQGGISTYRVVLQFSKADSRIRSGMTATISIITSRHEGVLVVPGGAVITRDGQTYVQVRRDKTVLEVPVTVGQSAIGNVEITSGLSSGDEIVLNPAAQ